MNDIETLNYPANSVTGGQLSNLKERIEAQPHIETMTHYTEELVNHTISTSQDLDTIGSQYV